MSSPAPTDDPRHPYAAAFDLAYAVARLTTPGRHTIARADPIADDTAAQLLADDRATTHELRGRVEAHLAAGNRPAAARVLAQLRDHRARVEHRRARIAAIVAVAYTPPLLDQLQAETVSSTGRGSGGSAGPYRSIIAIAATELLAHIEHTVGHHPRKLGDNHHPSTTTTPTTPTLTAAVRDWATHPADPPAAAALALRWVEQIATLLDPPKRWHHPGACPDCGHRTAHQPDDTGQLVRHPAIQFDRATGTARCLRCPAHWDTPAALRALARVLLAQQEE